MKDVLKFFLACVIMAIILAAVFEVAYMIFCPLKINYYGNT